MLWIISVLYVILELFEYWNRTGITKAIVVKIHSLRNFQVDQVRRI